MYQNALSIVKAVYKENFLTSNADTRKQEWSQVNNLSLGLKKVEKWD